MTPPMPAPPVLCPRACVTCSRLRPGRWWPCSHPVGHDNATEHECSDHRYEPGPATVAAAHALDDVRAGNPLRLAP